MEMSFIEMTGEFINTVGFPVAVCVALFISNHQNEKNQTKILKEFREVLKENTEVLKTISQKVEK